MNPFSNNRPRLTASEGIRNKRDKTIYQAEKQRFQNHKTCGNKNVRYYDNGTIRSMQGYKLQQSLARGNVLCEDCNDRGTLCGEILNKDALGSIQMGNNVVSEYWGGAKLSNALHGSPPTNVPFIIPGWNVVVADISGTWDPSGAAWKGDISPGCIDCSYGYMPNEIAIPRNLDGSGIVIDPSNVLFPDELCDPFRYLQKSYLKTYLVVRGGIQLDNLFIPGSDESPGNGGTPGHPGSCSEYPVLYSFLPGKKVILQNHCITGCTNQIVNGTISSLCCIKNINMFYAKGGPPSNHTVGIFDMYIELSYINDMPFLSKLINFKPQYYPTNVPTMGTYSNNSGWDWLPLCSVSMTSCTSTNAPFVLGILNLGALNYTTYNYIESFKLIQGTIPPTFNQTKYNATKQSYMSCLEDGTKKINFTKNTKQNNSVLTAYCKNIDSAWI